MNHARRLMLASMSCWLALLSVVALAEAVPPLKRESDAMPAPTLARKPTTGLIMGRLSVNFEKSTLGEIRDAIGIGTVEHRGDAGGSIYWLCYSIPSHPVAQRVWLIADGEMGGNEHRVTGVHALQSAAIRASNGCPLLQQGFLLVHFDNGLWLGQARTKVTNTLGSPSAQTGGWWSYSYAGKAPGLNEGHSVDYDVTSLFEAQLKGGTITAIIASQVTSY
jgi:hypothetical protein